jgi:7-keto-8-aminopelargonate synthetase-like enzyme
MREALAAEGLTVTGSETQVMSLAAADEADARRFCAAALEEGVVVEPIAPPALTDGGARVRLAVMSSHARPELVAAAQALGRAAERGATGFFDAESRLAA